MNDVSTTSDENGMHPDGVDKWQEIACGSSSHTTVGVTPTGALYSWGCGGQGQLGHGNKLYIDKPKLIGKNLFCKKAQNVACGDEHTVVLTTEGEV